MTKLNPQEIIAWLDDLFEEYLIDCQPNPPDIKYETTHLIRYLNRIIKEKLISNK